MQPSDGLFQPPTPRLLLRDFPEQDADSGRSQEMLCYTITSARWAHSS
jgi:hypothetical protein